MFASCVRNAKEKIPLAEETIVHDRFHVMKLMTNAVYKARRQVYRKLKMNDDSRLTEAKILWIKSQDILTDEQLIIFDGVVSYQLATAKVWACKEILRDLWHHKYASEATHTSMLDTEA